MRLANSQEGTVSREQEERIVKLRAANQHLVISTLSAQDKQANAEAETHNQTKFLSMLAHELRNPLQPIMHATALLGRMVSGNVEQTRLQSIIARQVGFMARMIDDLLDASRIANGKISLEKTVLALSDVIRLALEVVEPQLMQRQQKVDVMLPEKEVYFHADRVRLTQILSNLLNNASKFSSDGQAIEVSAQVLSDILQITVRDHGVGISPELQPLVFDLFTQGQQSSDRAHGGLGIGLTLVRALVELHDGAVTVHSDGDGTGTTFTVHLSLHDAPMETAIQARSAQRSTRPLSIMLVEDNADANDSLRLLLERSGHSVHQEFDGVNAVSAALKQHFDLIICDIGLPGKDGFAVISEIKSTPNVHSPICIALSGYSRKVDDAAADTGFDAYVVKPVDFDILLQLIEKHVH